MSIDPFTQVYEGLWELLTDHPIVAEMVPVGNRIVYDGRSPEKAEISSADVPELRILPLGISSHLERSSSTSFVTKTWSVQLATGDNRLGEYLYPLEWAMFCALQRWRELRELKWNDSPFLSTLRVLEHAEGKADRDLVRGIDGWTVVMTIEASMVFQTRDMLAWYDEEAS